jgi:hypothetical protein
MRSGFVKATVGRMGIRKLCALTVGVVVAAALASARPAAAGLGLLRPDPNIGATFIGQGGYSADGLGQQAAGGTIQAEVPAGSTVVHAYLYGGYTATGGSPPGDLVINFDGANVTLTKLQTLTVGTSNLILTSARADVTAQVAQKVSPNGGQTSFTIANDPTTLEGVALVVIYSNPRLPTTTIAVLDGAASPGGDTATFTFAKPIDPTAQGFQAGLSLGSSFSYQGEAGHVCGTFKPPQSSLVNVNGKRLTSCAGGYDDGEGANAALITVGGVGDSPDNPANPNQQPGDGTSPRGTDDELYNLRPFLGRGDTQLTISTANPSHDDLLFLAVVSVSGEAGVTTTKGVQPPPPVVGKSFNAQVVRGVILCRAQGGRTFTRLTQASQLKTGSECDATRGVVRITTAAGPARTRSAGGRAATPLQTADVSQGRFVLQQKRSATPTTDVSLSGGDFKQKCGRKKRGVEGGLASDPRVRSLAIRGKGRFRTKGRYSSAAPLTPTKSSSWQTEDRCHGTSTHVKSGGKVVVTDSVRHKHVTVGPGKTYVAKAPGRQQKGVARVPRTWFYRSWPPLTV